MVKNIHSLPGLFTFLIFKSGERSERMGHYTFKSMGGVFCVMRRSPSDVDYSASLRLDLAAGSAVPGRGRGKPKT